MSKCISRHGEYSEHEFDNGAGLADEFTCVRCWVFDEDAAGAEIDRLRAAIEAVRVLHQPRSDGPMSLITWTHCSCGARELFRAEDGYTSIGPAEYPCATVRALGVVGGEA